MSPAAGAGEVRRSVAGGVATITIDNPATRNAMTAEMYRAIPPLFAEVAADPAVRVAVLTGAGGTFCSGADIGQLDRIGHGENDLPTLAEEAIAACPKPVIAAIRGHCYGGGCQLAAACDLRIAADDARFAITPAKLGVVYPVSALRRLVRLAGAARVKYLVYTADAIDAERALREGFYTEVVPGAALAERVAGLTAVIGSRSQFTVHATKDILDRIDGGALTPERVAHWRSAMWAAGDLDEGVAAFEERRAPGFPWTGSAAHPDG
ncbi:enoyl-CoA hydratase/isomerase family protein [Nocardiopsis mangrovi]|uniref:Enoyl-CoA hydratase/isomerase family protein n=1 Tax=Nocardiopsis mangrovi TaxID=1179818 RepID=A0ABV9E048_9ACTN